MGHWVQGVTVYKGHCRQVLFYIKKNIYIISNIWIWYENNLFKFEEKNYPNEMFNNFIYIWISLIISVTISHFLQ